MSDKNRYLKLPRQKHSCQQNQTTALSNAEKHSCQQNQTTALSNAEKYRALL